MIADADGRQRRTHARGGRSTAERGKGGPRGQQVSRSCAARSSSGRYEPGERLIEATLSTELGTSRGPVREALRQLENEGLVMSFPYRGAVVLGVSDEEVQEVLIPIRLTLERYSFVARARADDRRRLRRARQADLADGAGGEGGRPRSSSSRPTSRFHEIVISALRAAAHGADLAHDLAADPRLLLPLRPRPELRGRWSTEHRELLAALQTRDPDDRCWRSSSSHIAVARPPQPRSAPKRRAKPAHERDRTLLAVENLRTGLRHARRLPPRRRRRRLRDRAGRHARRRRRVGQRQVRDRALDHAARSTGPAGSRPARASSSRAATSRRSTRTRWRRSAATTSR